MIKLKTLLAEALENKPTLEKETEDFGMSLIQKYPQLENLYFYVGSDNSLYLSSIRVKLEYRHMGVGKSVIRDIKKFADDHGLVITLSPEPEKKKYTKKLDRFYKDLGFVDNKGRNKDYRLGGAFGRIMYRRPGINEVVDGHNYFTKEKFGTIILSELQKEFPSFAIIKLIAVFNGQEFKHNKRREMRHNRDQKSLADRSAIYNSNLWAVFSIEYNDKEYEVRIVNTFKKVPDRELTDKFTMADDEFLKRMPFKSLEPKDLNVTSDLMVWKCSVKREDGTSLIPKKTGYAILFDEYKNLREIISDVKKVIDKDSGFGGDEPLIPDLPKTPSKLAIH